MMRTCLLSLLLGWGSCACVAVVISLGFVVVDTFLLWCGSEACEVYAEAGRKRSPADWLRFLVTRSCWKSHRRGAVELVVAHVTWQRRDICSVISDNIELPGLFVFLTHSVSKVAIRELTCYTLGRCQCLVLRQLSRCEGRPVYRKVWEHHADILGSETPVSLSNARAFLSLDHLLVPWFRGRFDVFWGTAGISHDPSGTMRRGVNGEKWKMRLR